MAAWKKGQSGNLKGRPPTGLAFGEYVRANVAPKLIVDAALKIIRNPKALDRDKIAAGKFLRESGWSNPVVQLEVSTEITPEQEALLGAMVLTPHERRQRIAVLESAAKDDDEATAAPASGDGTSED